MESKTLTAVGLKAVGMLDDNIEAKTDAQGKPFRWYSFGYWLAKKYKKKSRAKRGSKARKKWQESARTAYDSAKKDVTLSQTSNMRSAINVVEVKASEGKVILGFENQEAAQIAWYHIVTGAGKGRVRRNFWYLNEKQKETLAEYARDQLITDNDFAKELVKQITAL